MERNLTQPYSTVIIFTIHVPCHNNYHYNTSPQPSPSQTPLINLTSQTPQSFSPHHYYLKEKIDDSIFIVLINIYRPAIQKKKLMIP